MKIREVKVYEYDELSDKAKEKARDWLKENEDFPFLEDDMNYKLGELLEENGIKSDDARALYSLSYCQGDGAMFTGNFQWKAWDIEVRQSGHYYHEKSYSVWNAQSIKTGKDITTEALHKFEAIYERIALELKEFGYGVIEATLEDENIEDSIRANEYEFYEDGSIA